MKSSTEKSNAEVSFSLKSVKFAKEALLFLVCKASVLEMEAAIAKVDSYKKADVGSFRLSPTGEATSKKIPLVKSEQYLTGEWPCSL